MHLLSVLIRWMLFMRILMITTLAEKERFWLCLMAWFQTWWQIKNFKPESIKLLIKCSKLIIWLVFITQSYFSVPNVRLNSTHYLIMKINNNIELQNIAVNHSTDIDYKDFMKIYRECTRQPFFFFFWQLILC